MISDFGTHQLRTFEGYARYFGDHFLLKDIPFHLYEYILE